MMTTLLQQQMRTRKLVATAIISALSYVLSTVFVFPNMAPFQHLIDVLAAVLLGPTYATAAAIMTGLARMGFEGRPATSVVSILVAPAMAAVLYRLTGKIYAAVIGEVVGVGLFGALFSYPVMKFIYGLDLQHFYFYIPFFIPSALVGAVLGGWLLYTLKRTGQLHKMQQSFGTELTGKADSSK